jgi:hypothetical protein
MLGKKLYNLISELDTSNRKLLFYKIRQTEDKRMKALAILLEKKHMSLDEFNQCLVKCEGALVKKGSSKKIKSDALRRFNDFAANEIENIKISVFIKQNQKIRKYILCDIYKDVKTQELQQDYLNKLRAIIAPENDFWLFDYYLMQESALKLRSQSTKDIEIWRGLLLEQKKLASSFFLKSSSIILEKIAASYLDDRNSIERLGKEIADEKNIFALIDQTEDPVIKSVFYLSLAKFNFEHERKFNEFSALAIDCLKDLNDYDSEITRRKIYFAKFLHAFHFGFSSTEILNAIEKVVEIDLKYKQLSERIVWFLFLTQLMFNQKGGKLNYFQPNSKKHFNHKSTDYFYSFLKAFEHFKNNQIKEAKLLLVDLSYSNNFYVATWSRQMEMVINLKQGNDQLVNSYLTGEFKKIVTNKDRIFTVNSSAFLLSKIAGALFIKQPDYLNALSAKEKNISPIHAIITAYLKNK